MNTIYAGLSGTTKFTAVSYTDGPLLRAVQPMLDIVADGQFRKRPFCTAVCCHVVPPMRVASESPDALEAGILAGMRILLVLAGQAGAMALAALAGVVAQDCAEVLVGMTDSKLPDAQSGGEKGYTISLAAHVGAAMIHECAGMHGSLMGTVIEP